MNSFDYSYSTDLIHAYGTFGALAVDGFVDSASGGFTERSVPSTQISSTRVCDRCILKKVKCDLQRPTCSRCIEGGWRCIYSSAKRKPGPVRGSRRKLATSASASALSTPGQLSSSYGFPAAPAKLTRYPVEVGTQEVSADSLDPSRSLADPQELPLFQQGNGLSQPHSQQFDDLGAGPMRPACSPWPSDSMMHFGILADDTSGNFGLQLEPEQEREQLSNFFTHVHPSIPLFRQETLLRRYESGTLSRSLLLTIFVVSAKILGPPKYWTKDSLNASLRRLLEANLTDKESLTKRMSLDNFRQACLLAFYAFHQYPGNEAWTRIGQLTRKAYQCGLHQIDNSDRFSAFERDSMSKDELDEWRRVWWFIYCLDSYSNITAATPFVVEDDSVKTALVTTSLSNSTGSPMELTKAIFLPTETNLLWKTTKEIINTRGDFAFSIHIVTTALLRQAATINRLRMQNPSSQLQTRLMALRDHLSTVRLALPARYLNPGRNALSDESGSEHHTRLISVLHLHAASILLCLPSDRNRNGSEWLNGWQQTLEYCQDITSIVKQWDSQYFPSVDPAVCFVISGTLIILHLHCCVDSSPDLQNRLVTYKDVLLLFLEQFASVWSLPRFLIMAFKKFSQLVSAPLSPDDVGRILRHFEGHLHPRWLNFLSLTSAFEDLNMQEDTTIYQSLSSREWDFNDWAAVTGATNWNNVTGGL